MRKKKNEKLNIHDINKNNSKDISHTINKIKENEWKYMMILVLFFVTLFFVIGYVSLKIKTLSFFDYMSDFNGAYVSLSSNVITLDENDKMSDIMGLNSNGIDLVFQNTINEDYNYKIILIEDFDLKNRCGCSSEGFNIADIRYSLDESTVKNLSGQNMLLTTGYLEMGKKDKINLKIWLDKNSQSLGHFHGRIFFEKIEED